MLTASFLLASVFSQAEETAEVKGIILSLEQDKATVSLEIAGSVKLLN